MENIQPISEKLIQKMMKVAKQTRRNAFPIRSLHKVWASVLTAGWTVIWWCNVESVISWLWTCAERCAFVKAISEGKKDFEYIIVVGGPKGSEPTEKCLPCGYCRQFMSEFVDENFKIIVIDNNEVIEYKIADLLPNSFRF